MGYLYRLRLAVQQCTKRASLHPERFFIVAALSFGLLMVTFMPPLAGWDEEAHFVRAYGISQGVISLKQGEGVAMPTSYRQTIGCLQTGEPVPGDIYRYRYSTYLADVPGAYECIQRITSEEQESVATTAAAYSPLSYIPQVAAIIMGRAVGMPIIGLVYLVRLSVLIVYVGLMLFAIRASKDRKWALVGMGLLPYSILQVTNPGADYLLAGGAALYLTIIGRSLQKDGLNVRASRRTLMLLAAMLAVLATSKGLFPGICLLPFLLLYGGFREQLRLKVLLSIVVMGAGLIWQRFIFISGMKLEVDQAGFLPGFVAAFLKTMFYEMSDVDFLSNKIGIGLDSQVGMPAIIVSLINILIGMYLFVEYRHSTAVKLRRIFALVGLLSSSLIFFGTFAAFYLAGSYLLAPGENVIKGVQARYFYPALLLLVLLIYKRPFKASQTTFATVTICGSIVALTTTIATLLVAFRPFS